MMRIRTVSVWASFSLLVSGLFVQSAFALDLYNSDELLNRLKKNQVLSENDITEVKNSYPKLELGGCLQVQYMNGLGTTNTEHISDLFMRRLKLNFDAHLTDQIDFVIEPEYGRQEPSVKDAYLSYRPSWFGIFAGNHRVPFSADGLKNDINLPFAERNLASQLSPDYLPGVSLIKPLFASRLLIQAGIWNGNVNSGAETDLINNNLAENQIFSASSNGAGSNILIKAIRVAFASKGSTDFYTGGHSFEEDENFSGDINYRIGLSYYDSASVHDRAPANGLTGLNGAHAFEADLMFRFWRMTTEFEYARRSLDWWQNSFAQSSSLLVSSVQLSYAAQASLRLFDNLSFSSRYETFTYDDKDGVLKGVFGQDKDKWFTLGLNYYFKEQHTKLQANYVVKSEDMPAGIKSPAKNTAFIQATMYF